MQPIRRRCWAVFAVAAFLMTTWSIPLTHAASKKSTTKPGVDKNLSWQRIGINEARKAGKPIFLYVYDPLDGKASEPVKIVQENILANSGVRQALTEFTPILQPISTTSWPPVYTQQAKNGVALFIMTCNGNPVATFTHRNLPKVAKDASGGEQYPLLQAAAAAAVQANPKVLESLKKNPPKDYISAQELAAEREAAAQPPAPEEPKGNAAAGLLEEPGRAATRTADAGKKNTPPEEKPAPKVVDEVE